jgi:hypothetical protein
MNDKRTKSLTVSSIPHLPSTGTELLGCADLGDVRVGIDAPEEGDGILCLGEGNEMGILDDERDFKDGLDSVTTGHDKGGDGGGRDGRNSGVSLFIEVDFDVPFAPGLGGSETTTATAHVAKGSLAGTMSSSTADTRDTSDSSSCAPGFCRSLRSSSVLFLIRSRWIITW